MTSNTLYKNEGVCIAETTKRVASYCDFHNGEEKETAA